jgi:two-component system cell cycle response regulator DivK
MPTILIVEDNEPSRDALARRLERRNYVVLIAGDGHEAISVTRTAKPDLILMDLRMPSMDGWDATALLKLEPETRHIPIIVLSAHALPNERHQALAAGGDDFDTKPVQFDRLLGKIDALLASNRGLARASA